MCSNQHSCILVCSCHDCAHAPRADLVMPKGQRAFSVRHRWPCTSATLGPRLHTWKLSPLQFWALWPASSPFPTTTRVRATHTSVLWASRHGTYFMEVNAACGTSHSLAGRDTGVCCSNEHHAGRLHSFCNIWQSLHSQTGWLE